jgi:hypothetical protein
MYGAQNVCLGRVILCKLNYGFYYTRKLGARGSVVG